jgi:hypothetical protein
MLRGVWTASLRYSSERRKPKATPARPAAVSAGTQLLTSGGTPRALEKEQIQRLYVTLFGRAGGCQTLRPLQELFGAENAGPYRFLAGTMKQLGNPALLLDIDGGPAQVSLIPAVDPAQAGFRRKLEAGP